MDLRGQLWSVNLFTYLSTVLGFKILVFLLDVEFNWIEKIHLSCGVENQVTSVTEPNRCEYEIKFTTPAVCKEPKNPSEGADVHDEL